MIQGWVFSSVQLQIEDGAGRADLPFWDVRFPRHVLRDLKTWRGFDVSSFGRISVFAKRSSSSRRMVVDMFPTGGGIPAPTCCQASLGGAMTNSTSTRPAGSDLPASVLALRLV